MKSRQRPRTRRLRPAKDARGNNQWQKQTFKDVIVGKDGADVEHGPISENTNLLSISTVENWPSISFTDKFRAYLRKPWEDSLIVKLLGKTISHRILYERLHRLWNPKGEFGLVEVSFS